MKSIAAGGDHTVVLKNDGSVWAWGGNLFGQLGDGTATDRSTPVPVSGMTGVLAISAGDYHTVALKSDGSVWASGARSTLTQVIGLNNVVAIADGGGHTLALKSDGSVWAWGSNSSGQLGDGTTMDRTNPVPVSGLTGVIAISAGGAHSVAIKSDGSVWSWGDNGSGELGDGTTTERLTPVHVNGLTGVIAVDAGIYHTTALKGDGSVWAWGDNFFGELGDGTTINRSTPVQASGLTGATSVSAGYDYTVAVKSDGSIWTWGLNSVGMLGDGTFTQHSIPAPVTKLVGVIAASAGVGHTVALTEDGNVWSWGDGSYGDLGDGAVIQRTTPNRVNGLTGVIAISAGGTSTIALKGDGNVWAWGDNGYGQLGDGTTTNRATPVEVSGLTGVTAISAGGGHVLSIRGDGTVWSWGNNGNGQLGNGSSVYFSTSPVMATGLSGVVAVSGGGLHSVALKNDGSVWTWGLNSSGQLGDGTTTDRSSPVRVIGLTGVVAISAGGFSTVALKSDGSVWAWGANSTGALGDGTLTNKSAPVLVNGLSGVIAISAGVYHTVALKNDGNLWAWGSNGWGELGDGTTVSRSTPAPIGGLTGVVAVSASYGYTLALKGDGSVWAWGQNFDGQLGDGTLATRARPAVVLRESGAGAIQTNDWFLDLNPAVPKTIPTDNVPAFLVIASGEVTSTLIANIQFPAQDSGHSIHVFAYAPSTLAKIAEVSRVAPKDGPSCVLSQLTSAGTLQPVSASNLQPYVNNVVSSQQQAVTVLNNVPASQVAGATFCVGSGTTGTQSVSAGNNVCVATVPSPDGVVCPPPDSSAMTIANVPGALSGLWWNSTESGWGIAFTQRRNIVFAAWYTYDAAGNPKWYVASNCTLPSGNTGVAGSCSGSLYEVSGPAFFGTPFNSSLVNVATAGTLQVSFQDANNASMSYTVGTQSRTVAITRQPFPTGTTAPAVNYTDLWWNPNESGWGIEITHQFDIMFLAWYVYDGNGKPVWYVASNCNVNASQDGCAGTLYRTTGPAFGPTFNSSQVQVVAAGTVSLNFSDPNNGTLSYTVNGTSASKAITRQLF